MESRWSECISVRYHREREVELHVNLAGLRLNDEDALEWSSWTKSYLHHRRCKRTVATIDVSRNNLGEAGLAHILTAAAENLGGGVRKLRAHYNNMRSVPLQALLSCGERLGELHLSHNQLDGASIHALLGRLLRSHRYPLDGKTPLWLRLEKNPGCAGDQLSGCSPEYSRRICVVDGKLDGCTPGACRCARAYEPALHLTYLSMIPDRPGLSSPDALREETRSERFTEKPVQRERISAWTPAAAAARRNCTDIRGERRSGAAPQSRSLSICKDAPLQTNYDSSPEPVLE